MRDAASEIDRMADYFARGIITPKEFGQQVFDSMLHHAVCEPAVIFSSLSADAKAAVMAVARQYAEQDYLVKFHYIGVGETPEDAIARQPVLRKLCQDLLGA